MKNTVVIGAQWGDEGKAKITDLLAEKADLSISYIKQIESGSEFKNVSLTAMLKLSKALGITVRDLFEL